MVRRLLFASLLVVSAQSACASPDYETQRAAMIGEIEAMVRETQAWLGSDRLDARVMAAMSRVPRHEFVPENVRSRAYENRPLPIGEEQTISQPYIVALMTDLAGVEPDSTVLEIGTGSGYQAAVLAELGADVYTVEIIASLSRRAESTLRRLGYGNVHVRTGDGYAGWGEHAPYDAILVTAAPDTVPGALLAQLKPGGRLVIPVGRQGDVQSLQVIVVDADGKTVTRDVLPVGFVPLVRESD